VSKTSILNSLGYAFKITLMTITPPPISKTGVEAAQKYTDGAFAKALETLSSLVSIPGIAWDAFDASELERSAEAVAGLLRETDVFESVEILRSATPSGPMGAPAVVATRAARNSKPTILLYAHHDVQPPGADNLWESEPFKTEIRNGRMYGRGAADDKAGVISHVYSIKALRELTNNDFDLGLVVFIEGEEEAGSPSFANFLVENKPKLASEVIIVADSGNWTTEVPAITTTLRGLVSLEFEVSTLDHAVHSGMYGGAVPDAMLALTKILGSMWDENGSVSISGLISENSVDLAYSEQDLRVDSGLLPSTLPIGEGGILGRLWTKPSLTLIGLDYPSVAISSNTLVPSVSAKLSLRIAPGQVPSEALEALKTHILTHNPLGAQIDFGAVELGKPFSLGESGWAKDLASRALRSAYGFDSVDIGIGGSIPFIADLEAVFPGVQVLVTGVEDPDSRAHSPNESLDIETLRKAIIAQTLILLGANQVQL
jgi:acetylornithine deacetylase/succinyl-diaminopimelate desuccinylase-like protein